VFAAQTRVNESVDSGVSGERVRASVRWVSATGWVISDHWTGRLGRGRQTGRHG